MRVKVCASMCVSMCVSVCVSEHARERRRPMGVLPPIRAPTERAPADTAYHDRILCMHFHRACI